MFERLINWLGSLKRAGGIELPPGGRSSIENSLGERISAHLGFYKSIPDGVDFDMLRCLKMLWIFNPDLSQYVSNIVHLGNTGHRLLITAKNQAQTEKAIRRLNEAAGRLYMRGAGVDGLLNSYFAQVAWSGALSSEDVVNLSGRRVESVAIVPVEQIRFVYENDNYVAHQARTFPHATTHAKNRANAIRSDNQTARYGLIKLNPLTYKYYALTTVENSPYAKPPASAAVGAITGPQSDMLDNLKWISKKLGILGLVTVMVTPPQKKPNETEPEFQTRAQRYLASIKESLDQNFTKGLLITYRDQKIEHANVSADARGAYDLWRMNEEQVMSGLAMQPAFFGRTDSTTETYAGVVYNLLLAQVANIQRMVKRRQEATYKLDLLLAGIDVDTVSIVFNRPYARQPLLEAQAEQTKVRTAIDKVQAGLISQDMAAQELGYETAFKKVSKESKDAGHSTSADMRHTSHIELTFDRAAQAYKRI